MPRPCWGCGFVFLLLFTEIDRDLGDLDLDEERLDAEDEDEDELLDEDVEFASDVTELDETLLLLDERFFALGRLCLSTSS